MTTSPPATVFHHDQEERLMYSLNMADPSTNPYWINYDRNLTWVGRNLVIKKVVT